ncbi:hypothetical protein K9M79_04855 [Candidatus Woesearchaeota archaeon]|nr:hypothetical protein [Candidatus Woesearchaeota archaeon]
MGWKCLNCGNNRLFIERNLVDSLIYQDENSNVKRVVNKYIKNGMQGVSCRICNSNNIKRIEAEKQPDDFLYTQKDFVSPGHSIKTIVFELTNKCDANCVYCPKYGVNELDYNQISRLIVENNELDNPVRHFELGWDMGNPLLHSRINDIIGILREDQVNILTNGKNFMRNIEGIEFGRNHSFTFFLDHPDKELNDHLMGEGVYRGTLQAFKWLKDSGFQFRIYMRLSSENCDQIKDMVSLTKGWGTHVVPTEIYPLGEAKTKHLMSDGQKRKAIGDIERLNLNKSIHFSPTLLCHDCTYQRKLRLVIDASGNLSFCHFLTSIPDAKIVEIGDKHILELIKINYNVRKGFLENKASFFDDWIKPRKTSSPCSYCLHSFGIKERY